MADVYRYPLKLDRDDPRDMAVITALQPLIRSRRAAHVIRDLLYRCLVDGASAVAPVVAPSVRAKRAVVTSLVPVPDDTADSSAFDALLDMF